MMYRLIIGCCVISLLSGCLGVFLAGAGTSGLIAYDSRSLSDIRRDESIRQQLQVALNKEPTLANISVSCFHQNVLLVGQVPQASLRVKAEQTAKQDPKVNRIYNEICVKKQPDRWWSSVKDSWLTTKVKTTLLSTPKLHSGHIKVVTERGVVYLMGRVTKQQAHLAVEAARRLTHVKRVVKAFEYMDVTAS